MKKVALLLMVGVTAGLGASCGKEEKARSEPAVPVVRAAKTEIVQPAALADEYEALGTVRSKTVATLSAKVVGTVVAVRVREGERVDAGQVLVEVDARDARTQAEKANAGLREAQEALEEVDRAIRAAEAAGAVAEANRDLAQSTYRRFETLVERGSVSQQEFEEVRAKYRAATADATRAAETRESLLAKRRQVLAKIDQAKADVAGAQIGVSYSRVSSPIAGVIVAKQAEVGILAAPGVPLVTVEDDSRYRLEASVEESRIGRIRQGQKAVVRIDALGDGELEGWVEEIAPLGDPATRTYIVKIGLPTPKAAKLRSGLFGRAFFRVGARQALLVPESAVAQQGQLTGVFTVDAGNIARLRLIRVGKRDGDRVEVLSGLSAGERIVVDRTQGIIDGARIEQMPGKPQ